MRPFLGATALALSISTVSPSAQVRASEASLQGVWERECFNRTLSREVFFENKVALQEIFNAEEDCTHAMSELVSAGTFAVSGEQMDFVFESVTLRPLGAAMAKTLNDAALCGFSGWKAGVAREITGLACDFFGIGRKVQAPAKGDTRYGIYRIEGKNLYFGQLTPELNGKTPAKRPVEFDPRFYSKQGVDERRDGASLGENDERAKKREHDHKRNQPPAPVLADEVPVIDEKVPHRSVLLQSSMVFLP